MTCTMFRLHWGQDATFLLFLWRDQIYACSSINIMSELDSTRQKFDAWIVECAVGNAAADLDVEFLSNLICWIKSDKAEMRRMNWALRNQDILTQDLCLDIYYSSCFVEYPLYPFPCRLPHLRSSIYDQSLIFINIDRMCSSQYRCF